MKRVVPRGRNHIESGTRAAPFSWIEEGIHGLAQAGPGGCFAADKALYHVAADVWGIAFVGIAVTGSARALISE